MGEAMKQSVKLIAGLAMLATALTVPAKAAEDAVINDGTIAALGDPATALRHAQTMARRGLPRGEALLGYMYEHGLGVPQSWPAAVA